MPYITSNEQIATEEGRQEGPLGGPPGSYSEAVATAFGRFGERDGKTGLRLGSGKFGTSG